VLLVGGLYDGDPLDYLLASDASTRLVDAHAIFGRSMKALRDAGYEQTTLDRYTREALGVAAYDASDYPRLLRENYERLVRVTAKWVEIR